MTESKLENKIRVCIARHNAAFNTNYRVSVSDKVISISEREQTKPATPVSVGNNEQHPTQFEFVSYLATLPAGGSFKMQTEYKDRFETFADWCDEYASNTKSDVNCEEIAGELVITKGKAS